MSETKYTPTPWVLHRYTPDDQYPSVRLAILSVETAAVIHTAAYRPGVGVWEGTNFEGVRYVHGEAQIEADARLFLTAPDLLAIAREILAAARQSHGDEDEIESQLGRGRLLHVPLSPEQIVALDKAVARAG